MGRAEERGTTKQPGDIPPSSGSPHNNEVRSFFYGRWPVWIVAGATFLNGLLSILLTLFIQPPSGLKVFDIIAPFGLFYFNRSLTVTIGVVLIYLSFNLFQRRKVAWWMAAVGSFINIITDAVDWQLWPTAIVPSITLTLLIIFRKRFSVRSGWYNIERGLILAAVTLTVALSYGIMGFLYLGGREFGTDISLSEAAVRTFREMVLIGNEDLVPQSTLASWFLGSLRIMGIAAMALMVYSLFRPAAYRLVLRPYDISCAGAILRKYGRGSYDYFKVWKDKSYFFSETRESFLSYRVEWNTAVCLGDSVGPEAEQEIILRRFIRYCRDNGWGLVLMFPDNLPLYPRVGLHLLKIGEEGIVNLKNFAEETSQKKYFRYIRRRFANLGYTAERYKPPQPAYLIDEVEQISREWLKLPDRKEYGFVQGSFSREYVAANSLYIVRDSSGKALAFVNEVLSYRPGEATFDMMRHVPGVPNGTMDYIFQGLMTSLHKEGYLTLAMGVAPFAGVGEKPGSGLVARALHQLMNYNWFAHSKGLRQYKHKFEPYWEDRFIAYQGGRLALPKIALAITRAVEKGGRGLKGPEIKD